VTASGTTEHRGEPAALPGRSLLGLDPELGQLLTPERRTAAEHELRARVTTFPIGEWDGGRLADADPTHLGLLVVSGVLAREVVLSDTVSTELLGPGDVVRPWHLEGLPELLPVAIRWNALAEVRLALIDRRLAGALGRYPEIGAVIIDRLSERAQRLSITQAISQLNRVDRRLLALFWHLAERWGRVARDGIAVPLALSHRLIGELVGARRPTVSTALAELARTGQLVRRDDGTWLLTGEPPLEGESAADVIRQRRRLMPEEAAVAVTVEAEPAAVAAAAEHERVPDVRFEKLRASIAAAREQAEGHRRQLLELQSELQVLREQTLQQRQARARHLEDLRAAAARRR
jgi:CRP/FNR family transcriptional regulator, cyclic AMP receptor protein